MKLAHFLTIYQTNEKPKIRDHQAKFHVFNVLPILSETSQSLMQQKNPGENKDKTEEK